MESLAHQIGLPLAVVLSLSAMIFSLLGVLIAASQRAWAEKFSDIAGAVAGVILLGVSCLHLAPEALSGGGVSVALMGVGAGVAWLLTRAGALSRAGGYSNALMMSVVAIGVHSYLDGAVYVSAIDHHADFGSITGLGLIAHEGPEGLVVFALCAQLFKQTRQAVLVSIVVASVSTPIGALSAFAIADQFGHEVIERAFPIAAGLVTFAGLNLAFAFLKRMLLAPTE